MRDTESKRGREKELVSEMIALYCKKQHFSGPRMLFYHPIPALRHVIESRREKKEQKDDKK